MLRRIHIDQISNKMKTKNFQILTYSQTLFIMTAKIIAAIKETYSPQKVFPSMSEL